MREKNAVILVIIVNLIYLNTPCLGYHLFPTNTSLIRYRRQSDCSTPKIRCNDGTCVQSYKVCDGISDCPDGADEYDNCNPNGCSEFAFRCAYSACVDGDAKCNGREDCRDGSDEVGCNADTTTSNKCGNKFTCKGNGVCLPYHKVCDGISDCADGSDETFSECKNIACPDHVFRCSYGACVDGEFKCNGEKDCADGSDEDVAICGGSPVTPQPTTSQPPLANGFCPVLKIDNGRFTVLGQGYKSGPIPNFSIVKIACDADYGLYPPTNSPLTCIDGAYHLPVPQCKPICPPRISTSVEVTCTIDGSNVDCTKPVVDGTVAISKCRHLYIQAYDAPPVSTCQGGSWDNPLLKCTPECGQYIPKGVTNVIEGFDAKQGEFPWHIGLYRYKNDKYNYQCGGSIITPLIIISAAHCFTDNYGKKFPPSDYWIAAGKYYSDYNSEDDKLVQKSQVQTVHIPATYRGYESNFAGDIAVVIISKPFQMTNVVQPVCVDWQNQYEYQQLKPNNYGNVVGWGFVDPFKQTASVTLKQLTAPYIDQGQCLDVVPAEFRRWVTLDKFCAGHTNGSSVCKGDSGGGMVFEWKENNREKFYLRGLVSVGPLNQKVCDNYQYGVYTKISAYKDFIINLVAQNQVRD